MRRLTDCRQYVCGQTRERHRQPKLSTESDLGAPASIMYHALMPRRARIRKLAKWLCTVLTTLLLIAWIASTRYSASHTWNVRNDPTPASARPDELVPFPDLADFTWVFRVNHDHYLPTRFRHQVGFAAGRIYFYHDDDDGYGWWEPDDPRWSMRPGFDARIAPERRGFRPAFFAMPLWFPFAVIGIPAGLLWRTDIRARRVARLNLCRRCGYNLAATAAAAPCPECGNGDRTSTAAQRHTRLLRNLARVGAILSLLLFTAWIGSAFLRYSYKWNHRQESIIPSSTAANSAVYAQFRSSSIEYWDEVGVGIGRAWIGLDMSIWTWSSAPLQGHLDLSLKYQLRRPAGSRRVFIFLPLWIPFLLVAIPTALWWRSGREWPHAARRA